MNTQTFWGVIGNYNLQTWMMQAVLFVLIILGIILSYIGKVKWAAKLSLGIANLFIGVVFMCAMEQSLFNNILHYHCL